FTVPETVPTAEETAALTAKKASIRVAGTDARRIRKKSKSRFLVTFDSFLRDLRTGGMTNFEYAVISNALFTNYPRVFPDIAWRTAGVGAPPVRLSMSAMTRAASISR